MDKNEDINPHVLSLCELAASSGGSVQVHLRPGVPILHPSLHHTSSSEVKVLSLCPPCSSPSGYSAIHPSCAAELVPQAAYSVLGAGGEPLHYCRSPLTPVRLLAGVDAVCPTTLNRTVALFDGRQGMEMGKSPS